MTGMFVQPPSGVWASSNERRALWAVLQVKHHIRRTVPERPKEQAWAKKLRKLIEQPVKSYDWKGWYARNVEGQVFASEDPHDAIFNNVTVPDAIAAAWAKVPEAVRELWQNAAEVRTTAEGLPFDPQDLERAFAEVAHQITGIDDTLREQLVGMMKVAMGEQEGQFGFARRLRNEWGGLSKSRSELIAVTEWNRAASAATYHGYVRQGVQTKAWITAGDEKVCPTCDQNGADGDIPIEQEFYSGDLYPPAHPGCRCNISSA